jgi:hypothetical protein
MPSTPRRDPSPTAPPPLSLPPRILLLWHHLLCYHRLREIFPYAIANERSISFSIATTTAKEVNWIEKKVQPLSKLGSQNSLKEKDEWEHNKPNTRPTSAGSTLQESTTGCIQRFKGPTMETHISIEFQTTKNLTNILANEYLPRKKPNSKNKPKPWV